MGSLAQRTLRQPANLEHLTLIWFGHKITLCSQGRKPPSKIRLTAADRVTGILICGTMAQKKPLLLNGISVWPRFVVELKHIRGQF